MIKNPNSILNLNPILNVDDKIKLDEINEKRSGWNNPKITSLYTISNRYIFNEHGEMWSLYYNKNMKPYEYNNNGTKHYGYKLIGFDGKIKNYYINRLLMFYFGEHEYVNIDDMPPVKFKDDNYKNWNIENIVFTSKSEILTKVNKTRKRKHSFKIPKSDIDKVIKLKKTKSLESIGLIYNCSPTSVARFIKRYKPKENKTPIKQSL